MGGMIALQLSLIAPSRVRKLILGCTTGRLVGGVEYAKVIPFENHFKRIRSIQGSKLSPAEKTEMLIALNVTPKV